MTDHSWQDQLRTWMNYSNPTLRETNVCLCNRRDENSSYFSNHISRQHDNISSFMKTLRSSQITNSLNTEHSCQRKSLFEDTSYFICKFIRTHHFDDIKCTPWYIITQHLQLQTRKYFDDFFGEAQCLHKLIYSQHWLWRPYYLVWVLV